MHKIDVYHHLKLTRVYRKRKDYDSALKELNQAAVIDPNNGQIFSELTCTYLEKGGCALAIKGLKSALASHPTNAHLHFELGRVYQRNKDYDLSLQQLHQAAELGLSNGMIHFELGKTLREMRNFDSAIDELKKAEDFGFDGDRLHLELGRVYRDQEMQEQAKKEFQTALRLNSQNAETHAELAWIYINTQEYTLAKKELQAALQKGFNQEDGRQILDKIHHNQQVVEKFAQAMDEVNHPGCITEYMFQEGYQNFIKKLKEITETNPKNLRAHIELAWIYSWHKQYELAIEELNRINEITLPDKAFLTELTRTYLGKKEYALAIEEFKKTLQIISHSNNQNDILKKEFIVTLKDLFPGREEEIEDLIKDLPKIDSLYNWRYPGMAKAEGEILYLITRLLKPEVIIEAGTWMGTSTSYLAKGCFDNKKGKVITVDIKEDVGYAIPEELLPYIEFHKQSDIRDIIPKICNKELKVDMFFHDSLNSSEVILCEIEQILPFINKDGLIIAHDVFNYNDPPGKNVAYFLNNIKDEIKCYFFKTEKGLGVIKDIERFKWR